MVVRMEGLDVSLCLEILAAQFICGLEVFSPRAGREGKACETVNLMDHHMMPRESFVFFVTFCSNGFSYSLIIIS